MSASLVGSEMCIRDRLWAAAFGRAVRDGAAAPAAVAEEDEGEEEPPVSYTHLTLPTICSV
eukprot:6790957-Alexandrium_andersonii.AAC.1